MSYIAHAGIKLANDECPKEKDTWHFIKQCEGIQYRWKFSKNHTYHVIAGVFDDPHIALKCAKQLYVTLFYSFVKGGFQIADAGCLVYEGRIFKDDDITVTGYEGDEKYFFWNKRYRGGELGPGVFEVEDSIDEFDEYPFFSVKISVTQDSDLSFSNVDEYNFTYCREAQRLFNTILLADNTYEYGMKMTIYCGLLEHLSENKDKEEDVINVIEELISNVKNTTLSKEKKDSLIGFLNTGRKVSAKQKCLTLCEKYAKRMYGGYSCKKVLDGAYSIRSAFSHGDDCEVIYSESATYIKLVVLDVIKNYMIEKFILAKS